MDDDEEEENDHDMMGLSDIERTHEERDDCVAFSYANGVEQRFVLNDNPHSFIGRLPINIVTPRFFFPNTWYPS